MANQKQVNSCITAYVSKNSLDKDQLYIGKTRETIIDNVLLTNTPIKLAERNPMKEDQMFHDDLNLVKHLPRGLQLITIGKDHVFIKGYPKFGGCEDERKDGIIAMNEGIPDKVIITEKANGKSAYIALIGEYVWLGTKSIGIITKLQSLIDGINDTPKEPLYQTVDYIVNDFIRILRECDTDKLLARWKNKCVLAMEICDGLHMVPIDGKVPYLVFTGFIDNDVVTHIDGVSVWDWWKSLSPPSSSVMLTKTYDVKSWDDVNRLSDESFYRNLVGGKHREGHVISVMSGDKLLALIKTKYLGYILDRMIREWAKKEYRRVARTVSGSKNKIRERMKIWRPALNDVRDYLYMRCIKQGYPPIKEEMIDTLALYYTCALTYMIKEVCPKVKRSLVELIDFATPEIGVNGMGNAMREFITAYNIDQGDVVDPDRYKTEYEKLKSSDIDILLTAPNQVTREVKEYVFGTGDARLILYSGASGAGKTTMAIQDAKDAFIAEKGSLDMNLKDHKTLVISADDYFTLSGIDYDPKHISKAHEWCQLQTWKALSKGKIVHVANTFCEIWEMKRYACMVLDSSMIVKRIITTGPIKNIHGVPEKKVSEMQAKIKKIKLDNLTLFDIASVSSPGFNTGHNYSPCIYTQPQSDFKPESHITIEFICGKKNKERAERVLSRYGNVGETCKVNITSKRRIDDEHGHIECYAVSVDGVKRPDAHITLSYSGKYKAKDSALCFTRDDTVIHDMNKTIVGVFSLY